MDREEVERIQDEHERIEILLDRLTVSEPHERRSLLALLERALLTTLPAAYRALERSVDRSDRPRFALFGYYRWEWLDLVRSIGQTPTGSARGLARQRELDNRLRARFLEVERELLGRS